ncbi:MAG TPA: (Fe-S)-binding protein [Gammaproteobacteria bacterium]|nr:(Fe-S)-binding protein [Gammaproteobacteria bacterium]
MPVTFPDFPLPDADRCVKCALCLPHCPTWRETRHEGESPRGRIALMQGFASGALDITPRLAAHLDHCLGCRACEAVCPAEVPYGKLIDAAHAVLERHGQRDSWLARVFAWWLRGVARLRVLHGLLWLAQRSGAFGVAARMSAPLARLTRLMPALTAPVSRRALYPAADAARGDVSLFLGCIARLTEPGVSDAAIAVLNAAGYNVHVPMGQACCGALDQHAGRNREAARLAARNLAAFGTGSAPVLSSASGCGATLAEYARLSDAGTAADFSARHHDLGAFLATEAALERVRFRAWPATVVLHEPCTLRNVLKTGQHTLTLLQRVPELKIVTLPANLGCCGAAGSYLLNQPDMADRLGARTAEAVLAARPAALITSNVGCAMHLAASLSRHGQPLPVVHPVQVLARQLPL